jgi:hypothetical protein
VLYLKTINTVLRATLLYLKGDNPAEHVVLNFENCVLKNKEIRIAVSGQAGVA